MRIRVIKDFDRLLKGDELEVCKISFREGSFGVYTVFQCIDKWNNKVSIIDNYYKNVSFISGRGMTLDIKK